MLNFISIDVYKSSGNNPHVRSGVSSFSFSDKTYPDRLCVVGELPHNVEISFDKENAQKMIDFCQKIVNSE